MNGRQLPKKLLKVFIHAFLQSQRPFKVRDLLIAEIPLKENAPRDFVDSEEKVPSQSFAVKIDRKYDQQAPIEKKLARKESKSKSFSTG